MNTLYHSNVSQNIFEDGTVTHYYLPTDTLPTTLREARNRLIQGQKRDSSSDSTLPQGQKKESPVDAQLVKLIEMCQEIISNLEKENQVLFNDNTIMALLQNGADLYVHSGTVYIELMHLPRRVILCLDNSGKYITKLFQG